MLSYQMATNLSKTRIGSKVLRIQTKVVPPVQDGTSIRIITTMNGNTSYMLISTILSNTEKKESNSNIMVATKGCWGAD